MRWLENALDNGITEFDFWNMTIAELVRKIDSQKRIKKSQQQEKAEFNYMLADLVGRSVARIYSSSAKLPSLSEAYPMLFDSEEAQEERKQQQMQLSVLRFKQYANFHNKKYEGGSDE